MRKAEKGANRHPGGRTRQHAAVERRAACRAAIKTATAVTSTAVLVSLSPGRFETLPARLHDVVLSTVTTSASLVAMPPPATRAEDAAAAADSPQPHHLAEQLPPISFESNRSNGAAQADGQEAGGSVTEKEGTLSACGEIAAGEAKQVDEEKAVPPAPGLYDYPDGGWRAWRCVRFRKTMTSSRRSRFELCWHCLIHDVRLC